MDHLLRATADAEHRHFWFRGFRSFVTPLVARATAGRPDARILDCGCGTGANTQLLRRYGSAFGFDLSSTGVTLGHRQGRTGLARGDVAAVPFQSGAFDLVTSFDVLYTLEAPQERQAVLEMYRLLRPGGFALVNVAASPLLTGDHSVLSHERRRYTRETLGSLLASVGFEIDRLTYTNATLFIPMLAARAFQRWRGLRVESEAQTEIRVPPEPINVLLTLMLRLESLWLRLFDEPAGSSLMCLARKPESPARSGAEDRAADGRGCASSAPRA